MEQDQLYSLYAGIRERLYSVLKESSKGDPVRMEIRQELAEEMLEHMARQEQGLEQETDYKAQWTRGQSDVR